MKKTFKEITKDIDMVLFNNIIKIDYELELEVWNDYDEDCEEHKDIYQYFVIPRYLGEYIAKITDMPLYYSPLCDLFILWVDFLDNWENISYEV